MTTKTMTDEEVRRRLEELPGWQLSGKALTRQFAFKDFAEAMAFTVRLGFAAEAADHHPDILITYRRVTLTYSTHSAGGITGKDFEGAGEATAIAARFGSGGEV